jgi:hypothetical protein
MPRRRLWKFLEALCGTIAIVFWLAFAGVWTEYDRRGSPVSVPAAAETYRLNTHGHVVYVTSAQRRNMSELQYAAISLFLIAVLIDVTKKPFRA